MYQNSIVPEGESGVRMFRSTFFPMYIKCILPILGSQGRKPLADNLLHSELGGPWPVTLDFRLVAPIWRFILLVNVPRKATVPIGHLSQRG
jgi:hypothetical protein